MNSVYFIGNVLTADQLLAFEAGTPNNELPHIFTNPFSNFFTNFGGGGSTLSLVICMLLFCKSERIKVLGRLSIVPGIFGINEPIIFGLPIVLNPIMIIPFIFVPLFNLVTSYLLTIAEILPKTTGVNLPWTTQSDSPAGYRQEAGLPQYGRLFCWLSDAVSISHSLKRLIKVICMMKKIQRIQKKKIFHLMIYHWMICNIPDAILTQL